MISQQHAAEDENEYKTINEEKTGGSIHRSMIMKEKTSAFNDYNIIRKRS